VPRKDGGLSRLTLLALLRILCKNGFDIGLDNTAIGGSTGVVFTIPVSDGRTKYGDAQSGSRFLVRAYCNGRAVKTGSWSE